MKILPSRWLLVLLMSAASGCATTSSQPVQSSRQITRPEVIVVRGLAGYWPGVDGLTNRLSAAGYQPRVIFGGPNATAFATEWANQIARRRSAQPVLIVGYSLGGNDAISMARVLQQRGIQVDSLVLIDAPFSQSIPANVVHCSNYYVSRPRTDWMPWFRGVAMTRESRHSRVRNIDLRNSSMGNVFAEENHFEVCFHPGIFQLVEKQIRHDHHQHFARRQQSSTLPVATADEQPEYQ